SSGFRLPGSTSGGVTISVPAAAGTTTFKLPGSNGSNGQCLQTDGSGVTSWASCGGGGGTPGGSSNDVQYNNAGAFGGIPLPNGQLVVGQTSAAPLAKTMSGDAPLAASGALTVANSAVTNAKLADMANATVKCRKTAGTGAPEDCALGTGI